MHSYQIEAGQTFYCAVNDQKPVKIMDEMSIWKKAKEFQILHQTSLPGPPDLMDVISYHWRAEGKLVLLSNFQPTNTAP